MAGTNKFIKFGTWELDTDNTYTDDELVALTTTEKQGIELGSIAYSDILNGLMRQLTHTNKALGGLVALKANVNVDSVVLDEATYQGHIETTIENIAKEVTVTKLASAPTSGETTETATAISADHTRSGITINTSGLVKSIVRLQVTDLPTIPTGTFLGRTATGAGTPSAITASAVLTAISGVPTSRTIAGTALTANISRDTIIGVATEGFVKRSSSANTYTTSSTVAISELASISSGTFLGRTATGSGAVSALSRDSVLGISADGVLKRTAANTLSAGRIELADLPQIATATFLGRTTADTGNVETLSASAVRTAISAVPTSRTIAGLDLTADRTRDDIFGISGTSGVVVKTAANTYGLSTAYALDANVAYRDSASPVDPTFWVGTQAQYDALTPASDVIYIIT